LENNDTSASSNASNVNSVINNEDELNDSLELPSIEDIDKITDISELKTILKSVIKRLNFVEVNTAKLMKISHIH